MKKKLTLLSMARLAKPVRYAARERGDGEMLPPSRLQRVRDAKRGLASHAMHEQR
jgi:hypothetical protein